MRRRGVVVCCEISMCKILLIGIQGEYFGKGGC